jgi:quinol monooxygenase YgiN
MTSTPETQNLKPTYAMLGKFIATPGNGDALANRLLEAASRMSEAPGCLQYFIYRGEGEDVWVSELWVRKEDHDNSLNLPGVREFIQETMPLIAGMESVPVTPLGGHGPKG